MRADLRPLEAELATLEQQFIPDDQLAAVSRYILDRAETQRREIGGAFAVGNLLRRTSKVFIKTLKRGQTDALSTYRRLSSELWDALKQLDIPIDFGWEQDSATSSELVEAEAVSDFHNLLFGDCPTTKTDLEKASREILKQLWTRMGDPDCDPDLKTLVEAEESLIREGKMDPSERKHLVTFLYQSWLAGIGDVPGEIHKFVKGTIIAADLEDGPEVDLKRVRNLYIRYIHICRTIQNFLDTFETCYEKAINNNRMRGWRNTFRGLLGRVSGMVERYVDKLQDLKVRQL